MYFLLNNFLTDVGCRYEQYIRYHHAIDVVGMIKRVIAVNGGGELISNEHVHLLLLLMTKDTCIRNIWTLIFHTW